MNLRQTPPTQSEEDRSRAPNATLFGYITALIYGVGTFYAIFTGGFNILWATLPVFLAALAITWLSGTRRTDTGAFIFLITIAVQTVATTLLQRGLGLTNAITSMALIGGTALAVMSRRNTGRVLMSGMILMISSVLIDQFGPSTRPLSEFMNIRWGLTVSNLLVFGVFFLREFSSLDIRTKIVVGILVTGGISLGVLAVFAIDRSGRITSILSERLETSVQQLAEEQLINVVFQEANKANQFFEIISKDVSDLAFQRASLEDRRQVLGPGFYWNATDSLFPLEQGQYGNSPQETASVFIPVNTPIDEDLIFDLNTSAYLDLSAPGMISANPSILAIYYIDNRGTVRYYPNVNLASLLPPDFDATSRPYFRITAPLFNPDRTTRWTIPYVDAAGGGLVVTVAAPVYYGEQFNGVVAADMQLAEITQQVSSIKIGQTGYAFMLDDAGRIISMAPSGYEMFGIDPGDLPPEEYFKQTVLGEGPQELASLTNRMVAGGNGLNIINIGGMDTYISYSPVQQNGYSLALVVPVAELQGAITLSRNETISQIQTAIQLAAVILIGLLVGAIVVSLIIGQIIATPIIRLTQTANKIMEGDMSARAAVTARDEIGTLAQAFNTMTGRLRETLSGLELRVQERTADLSTANEQNQYRARQFEAIAKVSRTINQSQTLQDLLPQIASAISDQFGFYHVGIFLLDQANEFAVLVASNSEGGQRMLVRSHKLRVGQVGIVGNVAGSGIPRIALDTGADAVFFDNPDLPETRSEIALPLRRSGALPMGVLDVQSTVPNAFSQEDIQILSTLAEQVALAIENARLFEQTRKALKEAETLYRKELSAGWNKASSSQKIAGILKKGAKTSIYAEPVNIPGEADVMQTGKTHQSSEGTSQITLPVKLRGEIVGILNLNLESRAELTADQMDVLNAIIDRAALSIENARLLLEAQSLAAKERTIGDISAKIGNLVNIENILQTTLLELGNTLPNTDIAIQFTPGSMDYKE